MRLVPPLEHDKLSLAARIAALNAVFAQAEGPVALVTHSAGVLIAVHLRTPRAGRRPENVPNILSGSHYRRGDNLPYGNYAAPSLHQMTDPAPTIVPWWVAAFPRE